MLKNCKTNITRTACCLNNSEQFFCFSSFFSINLRTLTELSKNINIMKTHKDPYEFPISEVSRLEIEGIICGSQTETPIDDPEEYGWDGGEG